MMEQFDDTKKRRQAEEYLEDYMGISELGKLFHSMIMLWEKYENRNQVVENINNKKESIYRIKLTVEQCIKISNDFYKSIGLDNIYKQILEGKTGIEVNIGKTKTGNNIWSSGIQEIEQSEYLLNVTDHKSIETLFVIVHEFMHAMTLYEEFNETKYLLREVAPHIAELVLYDFLLENKEKYNLNEQDLIHDIALANFMRYLNYYDKTNRCLRQDYIIALLINTQLEEYSKEYKEKTLLQLIELLEANDIIKTLETLGLKVNRKKENKRKKYIDDMFNNFTNLFEQINKKEKSKTNK